MTQFHNDGDGDDDGGSDGDGDGDGDCDGDGDGDDFVKIKCEVKSDSRRVPHHVNAGAQLFENLMFVKGKAANSKKKKHFKIAQ